MFKMKTVMGLVALSALVAACSGGVSESSESAVPASEGASAEEAKTPDDPMATKDGVAYASLTGDAASGKSAFAQCRTCHVTDPDMNRTGPSLAGIVGKAAGAVEGYNYSPANKSSGLTWTEKQLYVFLENPQRTIPKTKMIFAGMPDAQKRADVIAYLKDPS